MTTAAPACLLDRLRSLHQHLQRELFEEEGLATVFAHARNVLTATLVIAAGMYAMHYPQLKPLPAPLSLHVSGYVITAVGCVMLLLNLADGLRRLAQRRHHLLLRLAVIAVYIVLSMRLTQVIVCFRTMT